MVLGSCKPAKFSYLRNFSAAKFVPEAPKGELVSVKAYYIARGIDYMNIFRIKDHMYQPYRQEYQSKFMKVIIDSTQNKYVVLFKYGSVVFFNIPEEEHVNHLKSIGEVAVNPIFASDQHTENYKIILTENLDKPSMIKNDHVNIRTLDANNITILSTILAQTVALDYHAVAVSNLLDRFTDMNINIRDTGNFHDLRPNELHKLIASNNTIITSVLSEVWLLIVFVCISSFDYLLSLVGNL